MRFSGTQRAVTLSAGLCVADRDCHLIDNELLATQHLAANSPGKFFDVDYPIPEPLTRGKQTVRVKFVPREGQTAGPVFGVRLLTAKSG